MLDLVLEFIHHLAVFGIVGTLAAEFVMLAPGVGGVRLQRLAGFARVIWGDAGWDFYVLNWVFWTKIVLFVIVGLLSVPPTIAIARWRRDAKADPSFAIPADGVARLRRFFIAEFAVLAAIPIVAAIMARGIGL